MRLNKNLSAFRRGIQKVHELELNISLILNLNNVLPLGIWLLALSFTPPKTRFVLEFY